MCHENIDESIRKVMDIMVDNQLKQGEAALHELESIKGSKVDARGVEVQGQLDPEKEIRAEILACDNGFSTRTQSTAKLNGGNWANNVQALVRENADLAKALMQKGANNE